MNDIAALKAVASVDREPGQQIVPDRGRDALPRARPQREEQVEIALEIDRLADRCERASLPFVAYLLRVARAALAENMGERPRR